MEGHPYSNSNIEIENGSCDYPQQNSFLTSNYSIQISRSPVPNHRNYFQTLLEENSHQRSDEKNNEMTVQYDIYGNSISTFLSSPMNQNYSNGQSYEFARGIFTSQEFPEEMDIVEPEVSEFEIEKENIDPKGALTTPYKSRSRGMNGSLTGISTGGRSPLQDITPSVEKKKSGMKSSGIEVTYLIKMMCVSNVFL